jgi:hypothetical protein
MWNLISQCVKYCELSYEKEVVQNNSIIFIDDKKYDGQCYIFIYKERIVIAFRGTTSLKDWKSDFNTKQVSCEIFGENKRIKIHSGFHNQYNELRNTIHSVIIQYKYLPIHITGHSLGGALACLCAMDLKLNFGCDVSVVTFGSPRVGNKAFVEKYNTVIKNSFRVKNYGDPITHFPMRTSYYHIHPSICIKEGTLCKDKNYKKFIKRLWNFLVRLDLDKIISNHSLDLYQTNVNKMYLSEQVIDALNYNSLRPRLFSV